MADKPVNTGRKQKKDTRFKPGQSGNPAGKPPGARHKTTIMAQTLLDGQAEQLICKVVELALAGDTSALRLCLERLVPVRKHAPVSIQLSEIDNCSDAKKAMQDIIKAVISSGLTPEEGNRIITILESYLRSAELVELEERVKKIEDNR